KTVANVIITHDITGHDDNLAFSSLLCLEKLAEANSGLKDPLAIKAVITIAQGTYIKPVKEKANQVLNKLRTY
ncbi:MAG: HEAT repeat domain-containing protein, partial [Spirochaetales bacterium]|nr:HEAT repeat domain-containing protein [Spirochaetales bacterium]